MEFVDNTGHIFSLPSYDEKPIGYEYEEYSYIFWLNSNKTTKLSVNNFYSTPIYALYELKEDISIEDLEDNSNSPLDIEIYVNESNVYKLISSKDFQHAISKEDFKLTDYVDLNKFNSEETFLKDRLTNEDLYCIKTNEIKYASDDDITGTTINYLMIPIYPIGMATEAGTWITNIMIHIHNNLNNTDEWCYVSVGGEFVAEYEELIINGRNMGVSLPKDILKAIYPESLHNDEYNEALFNRKMKEYMLNYMGIKGNIGNFKSALQSLKWFEYGDKISISKLLKTDNEFKQQYILDYFNISNDILESYKNFIATSFISLMIQLNKETGECYPIDFNKYFHGESKPKLQDLLNYYYKVKIGNNNMPIENDDEKYWYWKPYFDFSFNELGIKLICLANYYKKYFLPIHINIHSTSLGYRVFANDIKFTNTVAISMTQPSIMLNNKDELEFLGNGVHYFTKQIHYIDDNFNEFYLGGSHDFENDNNEWYYLNDTCVNIPIKFKNNTHEYYNCVLLLQKGYNNETIYESHFSFAQKENYEYKNFIIYPKKLNITINDHDVTSNYFQYWLNDDFCIKLLVNNKWYEYEFKMKINNPTIDFGTLNYRYYLNDHNYLFNKLANSESNLHSILFCNPNDVDNIDKLLSENIKNVESINEQIYEIVNSNKSYVETHDLNSYVEYNIQDSYVENYDFSNIEHLYQFFKQNYNILSPFKQIKNISDGKVLFNSYMHNKKLVDTNEINFDINLHTILKYHLEHNLMHIDGTLLNEEFYQYIIYTDPMGYDHNIYIDNELIGQPISLLPDFMSDKNVIIAAYQGSTYVLREDTTEDVDNYLIINVNRDNTNKLFESEEDEYKNYFLQYEEIELKYDYINREYYSDDPKNPKRYKLYDRLYFNTDQIYSKYSSLVNLPNILKYKNSIHLFNIYTIDENSKKVKLKYNPNESKQQILIKYLNKEFYIGDNDSKYVYDLYNSLFNLKFNIYDITINENTPSIELLDSVYECIDELKLHSYLNYDFYLMHDNEYWYGLYISRETCNNVRNNKDLKINDIDKTKEVLININDSGIKAISLKANSENTETSNINLFNISNNGKWIINDNEIDIYAITSNDEDDSIINHITIGPNKNWVINNIDSGVHINCNEGIIYNFTINDNGYWLIQGKNTNIKAINVNSNDNSTNNININSNKNWTINGEDTGIQAISLKNENTQYKSFNDKLNYIYIGDNEHLFINEQDSGKQITYNGIIDDINIGYNYNWFIKNTDTGIKAIELKTKEIKEDIIKVNYVSKINKDGGYYWTINDINTNIKTNENIYMPNLSIKYSNSLGYKTWHIDGTDTAIKAISLPGDTVSANNSIEIKNNGDWYNWFISCPTRIDDIVKLDTNVNVIDINGDENSINSIKISNNGNWYVNGEDTGIKAIIIGTPIESENEDENTELNPLNYINVDNNGYWIINGEKLSIKAISTINHRSKNHINIQSFGKSFNWYINNENTNINAIDINGDENSINSINVDDNGYWIINGEDTGIKAINIIKNEKNKTINSINVGYDIKYLNWFINGEDTGIKAISLVDDIDPAANIIDKSNNGKIFINNIDTGIYISDDNIISKLSIGNNKNWFINDKDTNIKAITLKNNEDNNTVSNIIGFNNNGYWIINGENTCIHKISGEIFEPNSINVGYNVKYLNWFINGNDTNIKAITLNQENDVKNYITAGDNGYWMINNEDSGIPVTNQNSIPNMIIGSNGNWFIDSTPQKLIFEYDRSSEEYLLNRLEYVSSNGINQFNDDDIVCGYIYNNDRLPFNSNISSKWKIEPMSLGMSLGTTYDANGEMPIISLPKNNSKYEHGYYKVTVKYSLDRDIQRQFKNTCTIKIS